MFFGAYARDEPFDAVRSFLDEWEDGFYEYWQASPPSADASYVEIEEARTLDAGISRLHTLCQRAAHVYRAMLKQEVPAELNEALREVADVPTLAESFDTRRLSLTPDLDLVWQHIDLALIRDALEHIEHRPREQRRQVYQLLVVTAVEDRINPVAAWYLQRAARLLLYGLDVECIAMCRAVLEAALRFALDEVALDRHGVERRSWNEEKQCKDFDLAGLTFGAKELGIWQKGDNARATSIRKLGNEVLHPGDPERFDRVTRDVQANRSVVDLAQLLRRIFPV